MSLSIPSQTEFNRTFHTDKVPTLTPRTQELFEQLQAPQDTSWQLEGERLQQIVLKKGLSVRDVLSPLFRSLVSTAIIASAILFMVFLPPASSVFLFAGPGYQVFLNTGLFTPAITAINLILSALIGMESMERAGVKPSLDCVGKFFLGMVGGPIFPLMELRNKVRESRPEVFHADQEALLHRIKEASTTLNRDYPALKNRLVELKENDALAELEQLKKYYESFN